MLAKKFSVTHFLTQVIWVLNVLLCSVICYLFNQDIQDTSTVGPRCPGPNCPGPKCPGPNCPGAQLTRIPVLDPWVNLSWSPYYKHS